MSATKGITMTRPAAERTYMSLWHVALCAVGIYELRRTHSTRIGKALATGMVLFHADAAISDAFNTKCLTRRLLEKATGIN
jgi:hypothetical protein